MRCCKALISLVAACILGGCCGPMVLLHDYLPGHHAGGHAAAQAGVVDPNAPQEYIMQDSPPAAPVAPPAKPL